MKKAIALLLGATLVVGSFAGCGKKETNSSSQTNSTQQATNESKPKPTLKMLMGSRSFDPNTYTVAKMLEEKTGYKVEYEMVPAQNANDVINLKMANREPYDILKLGKVQYNKLAVEGALEQLDDLLNKYGKTLLSVNEKEAIDSVKVNGKMFSIPEQAPRSYIGDGFYVRQDILDELNLKAPTNIDELYNVLKTIKEKKNMIPLTGMEGFYQEIASAFGLSFKYDEKDGKIIYYFENPAMKEYLSFMSKLYKEGLIDSEWPVNKVETILQKFTSGKAAIAHGSSSWSWLTTVKPALEKSVPTAKISISPALKDKNGKATLGLKATGVTSFISIPAHSKNKEDAIKWMDMKVQPELFTLLTIGEENVHYKKESDGKTYPILPIFTDERGNADMYLTSANIKLYRDLWLVRVRKDRTTGFAFDEMQKQAEFGKMDPLNYAPPLNELSTNSQKLDKLESDFMVKVIAGAEKLENYDKYLEQWKAEGGAAVLKEINDWYSKNNKK